MTKKQEKQRRDSLIGITKTMNCGLDATITDVLPCKKGQKTRILATFEDGFKKECILNNFLRKSCGHDGLDFKKPDISFHGFRVIGHPVFRIENEVYYKAIDTVTNETIIITPQQMIAWEKECIKDLYNSKEVSLNDFQ